MKFLYPIAVAVGLATSPIAYAQIMPQQAPQDTLVGGSGASSLALKSLGAAAGEIKSLRNMIGPSNGRGRKRTKINQISISKSELGGTEGYFLRSSYVTLAPSGFAPLHSHIERPAFLQVIAGNIHQHRSDGTSFVMGPGDFTFSSDGLVHWWSNEGKVAPTTLWVVELCSAAHGCKEEVQGGASQLGSSTNSSRPLNVDAVMSIDLAGEFPRASGLDERKLNLRRHDIAKGGSLDLAVLGAGLTYLRVWKGKLRLAGTSQVLSEGSIHFTAQRATGVLRNNTDEVATLYAVEFEPIR